MVLEHSAQPNTVVEACGHMFWTGCVLGGTGNASYLPIKHIGKPKEGEVAFVSGAAGATGFCAVVSY